MKIIVSPAKKMNVNTDSLEVKGMPRFMEETKVLCSAIRRLSYGEAKKLWNCNDKLAELNFTRFADMDLEKYLTPAVLAYEGLQYQHMSPGVFTEEAIRYVDEHVRILSGFYGVLEPFDGVVPYRLEMQAKLSAEGKKDLYDFWGSRIYEAVLDEDRTVINLASKEYSQAVEKYLTAKDSFITIEFGELADGKVKQKGTLAKMARGEMVRYMAGNNITGADGLKGFDVLGYRFHEELSSHKKMVFILSE
ncbi:peroxide stress protein YaaA [Lachnospiraceae bacterium 54-53]